jgi:methylenetetrahydrofolate dehydrogenase (NADP+) / methenyltetrahydrofolate cyclohydrolase
MRILDGQAIVDYVQERQARQVRALRQAHRILPKLAVVEVGEPTKAGKALEEAINDYADDILVQVAVSQSGPGTLVDDLSKLDDDDTIQGAVILPCLTGDRDDDLVYTFSKDIGGLSEGSKFEDPIIAALKWLIAGYNLNLISKRIVIVSKGGQLSKSIAQEIPAPGASIVIINPAANDFEDLVKDADVIITYAFTDGLITNDIVKNKTIIIAADSPSSIASDVYECGDLTITSQKDGLTPLVVCTLLDNLITSATAKTSRVY